MRYPDYDIVRLRPKDLVAMKEVFREVFGPGAHLWLFGSRTNLKARGGDIDLYIEALGWDHRVASKAESVFHRKLIDRIEDQRVDMVLNTGGEELRIYQVGRAGVQMV